MTPQIRRILFVAAVIATTVMAIGPYIKAAFTSVLVALGGTAIA